MMAPPLPANPVEARREALRRMWKRRIRIAILLAVFFSLPLLGPIQDRGFAIGWALCFSIVGLSLNVLTGYAGQISLAHGVLFGAGAFTLGNLVTLQGVPWIAALPIAGFATAIIALAIGFPALRIRGLHLAIATLAFHFLMQRVVFRISGLTGGAAGIEVDRPTLLGFSLDRTEHFLWPIMVVFVLIWILDRNFTRSRSGRALLALRRDEDVAASYGIAVARYKLLAFGLSGFYAGVGGAMFATLVGEVSPEPFEFLLSIEFLVFAVLGGLGSRAGTAVGAAFPVIFRQVFDFLRFFGAALGAALLVFTLIRYPGGLAAQGRELVQVFTLMWHRGKGWFLALIGAVVTGVLAGTISPIVFKWLVSAATPWEAPLGFQIFIGFITAIPTLITLIERLARKALGPLLELQQQMAQQAAQQVQQARTGGAARDRIKAALGAAPFLRPARIADGHRGPLLQISDLAVRFGGVQALGGVSLEVRDGELIGIMGPNGSGKTTLFNCISGFVRPDSGTVRFRGKLLNDMAPHDRASLGIARTFQHVGLVKSETVFDNFLIAQHQTCSYNPLESLFRTGAVVEQERQVRVRADLAVEMLGLRPIAQVPVASLPHGSAKMVELGCALVSGAELILLDEPAAGVDPQELETLGDTLKAVQRDFGVTVVVIEHHVPLVLSTCDYVYVLNFGQLLAEGEPAEIARNPEVARAYLGTAAGEVSDAAATHR